MNPQTADIWSQVPQAPLPRPTGPEEMAQVYDDQTGQVHTIPKNQVPEGTPVHPSPEQIQMTPSAERDPAALTPDQEAMRAQALATPRGTFSGEANTDTKSLQKVITPMTADQYNNISKLVDQDSPVEAEIRKGIQDSKGVLNALIQAPIKNGTDISALVRWGEVNAGLPTGTYSGLLPKVRNKEDAQAARAEMISKLQDRIQDNTLAFGKLKEEKAKLIHLGGASEQQAADAKIITRFGVTQAPKPASEKGPKTLADGYKYLAKEYNKLTQEQQHTHGVAESLRAKIASDIPGSAGMIAAETARLVQRGHLNQQNIDRSILATGFKGTYDQFIESIRTGKLSREVQANLMKYVDAMEHSAEEDTKEKIQRISSTAKRTTGVISNEDAKSFLGDYKGPDLPPAPVQLTPAQILQNALQDAKKEILNSTGGK